MHKERSKLLGCNFVLFLFHISGQLWGQHIIRGTIYGAAEKPLESAHVIVYDSTKTRMFGYAVSDVKGKYMVKVPEGVYWFKVSYLGYKPFVIRKKIESDEELDVHLTETKEQLGEVVIQTVAPDARIKNDTVRYALKRITTGNEENLKDILNKLPGIEVDENGKIKAQGKKIDKLLINGKDFFGDQHQLALENIQADMVSGVSLLQNYKDFSDLETETISGKIALNIEIDKKYRGQWKGNMDLGAGYSKKFTIRSNLYSFKDKSHFFVVGNANNIGKQTFSIQDYIAFRGGIDKFIHDDVSTVTFSSDQLPAFLLNNEKVEKKTEGLGALNFAYTPNGSFKLNAYVILNNSFVAERHDINRHFIDGNLSDWSLKRNVSGKFFVNNTFLNAVYKPSAKSVWEYVFQFSPQRNITESEENRFFDQFSSSNNATYLTYNQMLKFKSLWHDNPWSISVFHSLSNRNEGLDIESDQPFLGFSFPNNDYSLGQKINLRSVYYGIFSNIAFPLANTMRFRLGYRFSVKDDYFASTIRDEKNNDIKREILEHKPDISLYNKGKHFFNYRFGVRLSYLCVEKSSFFSFLPFGKLTLNIEQTHRLNMSFERALALPRVEQLATDFYVKNFYTLLVNQNLKPASLSINDKWDLNYFIHDLFSGTLFTFGITYSLQQGLFTTNLEHKNGYYVKKFYQGKQGKKTFVYLLLDKRLGKMPLQLRLKTQYSFMENYTFVAEFPNKYRSKVWGYGLELLSRFRKSFFNFSISYKNKHQNYIYDQKNESKLVFYNPQIKFYFNVNHFKMVISGSVETYETSDRRKSFIRLSPEIHYVAKNHKWTFYLQSHDILNLNTRYVIQNNISDTFIDEEITAVLPGYVLTGLRYSF